MLLHPKIHRTVYIRDYMGLFYISVYMGLFYIIDYMVVFYIRDYMGLFYIKDHMGRDSCTSETTLAYATTGTPWACTFPKNT